MKYAAICADPPWSFKQAPPRTTKSRSVLRHYQTMTDEEIKALPVADLAAKDCVLFLWTTDTALPRAFEVIAAWGFAFKTVGYYWAKTNKSGTLFTGCGWWTRANPEICLLATKGQPKRLARDQPRLVIADRREHSRKPDEIYHSIERLVDGPYCELFARTRRPNWDVAFSNQPDKFAVGDDAEDVISWQKDIAMTEAW